MCGVLFRSVLSCHPRGAPHVDPEGLAHWPSTCATFLEIAE